MPSIERSPSEASASRSQGSQSSAESATSRGTKAKRGRGARSSTTAKHSSTNGGFWIVAIAEGRSQGETGFAALDMRTCGLEFGGGEEWKGSRRESPVRGARDSFA